jgi:hypothetical protein
MRNGHKIPHSLFKDLEFKMPEFGLMMEEDYFFQEEIIMQT